jgi:transcriptional regulator with XRE-family HTH domain
MPEGSFGERLSNARRRKGLSISQVSEALRIRPSIIEALETATFEHMPLKGYARNMISSYARYLGLNPTQITEMFLHEYHIYEVQEARRIRPLTGSYPEVGSLRRVERDHSETATAARSSSTSSASSAADAGNPSRRIVHLSRRNTSTRTFWGAEAQTRRRGQELTPRRVVRSQPEAQPKRLMRGRPVDNRGYSGRGVQTGGTPGALVGFFARVLRPLLRRPVVLVVILAVVFVVLLVAVDSFAGSCSRRDADVLPITRVADSTDGVSEEEIADNMDGIAAQIAENARYGPFELKIEIVEGATWLTVNVDGQEVYSGVAEVGLTQVYTVTVEARLEAAAPGYVKVYRNEEPVELTVEDGLGIVDLKVEQKPVASIATTPNANSASASGAGSASGADLTGGTSAAGEGGSTGGASATNGSGSTNGASVANSAASTSGAAASP